MDWSKYSSLKSSKLASLGKEKQVTKEAVSEVKDDKGKVCLLYTSPSPRD